MPDDEVAHEAFAVIKEAMEATGTVGISRLVLARRERAVMLQPCGKGIILWTLRYGDEVRQPKEVFGDIAERKADPKLVTLVQKVIDERSTPWDPSMVSDPVQENLKELIAGKQKKKGRAQEAEARRGAGASGQRCQHYGRAEKVDLGRDEEARVIRRPSSRLGAADAPPARSPAMDQPFRRSGLGRFRWCFPRPPASGSPCRAARAWPRNCASACSFRGPLTQPSAGGPPWTCQSGMRMRPSSARARAASTCPTPSRSREARP